MTVGLSTLYLLISNADFKVLVLEIGRDRSREENPGYWEIVDEGQYSFNNHRIQLLKSLQQVGYKFTVHAPFKTVDIAHPDSPRRTESLRRVRQTIEGAAEIEAGLVVLHPGSFFHGNEELNSASLAELVDYGSEIGVQCGIENMIPSRSGPPVMRLSTPAEFKRFWSTTGSRAEIVFDVAHAYIGGLMEDFVGELASRIIQVHASDTKGAWDEHLRIGEGNIPWHSVVGKLGKGLFKGHFLVESVEGQFESVSTLRSILLEATSSQH